MSTTNTEIVHRLRGILLSTTMSDEHKIKAVRQVIIQAARSKRGPYKSLKVTADFAAYLRNYRVERVAQGICTCCGGCNSDRAGKAVCGACLTSARKQAKARRITK
jgi:hypothetical protein